MSDKIRETINTLTAAYCASRDTGTVCKVDPVDLGRLIEFAEQANAKNAELTQQRDSLAFKVRCVAQALK